MSVSYPSARARLLLTVFGIVLGLLGLIGLEAAIGANAAQPALEAPPGGQTALQPPSFVPIVSQVGMPVTEQRIIPASRPPDAGSAIFNGRSTNLSWPETSARFSQPDLATDPLSVRPLSRPDGRAPAGLPGLHTLAASPVITLDITYASVTGYTAAETPVHLVVTRGAAQVGEARARTDGNGYFTAELMLDGRWAAIQPGDVLQMTAGAAGASLTAPNITGTVDPAADSVTGQITGVPLPATLRLDAWGNVQAVATDGAGNFAADLTSLVDLTWFTEVAVSHQDADGDWLTTWLFPLDGMVINPQWERVHGYTEPGNVVTVTVLHDPGGAPQVEAHSVMADARSGWWFLNFGVIAAGDIVTREAAGVEIAATLPDVTATTDATLDQLSGTAPAGMALGLGQGLRQESTWRMDSQTAVADPGGTYAVTFPAGQVDALSAMYVFPHVTAAADLYLYVSPHSATAHWAWNEIYGNADPGGSLITAQLTDGGAPPAVLETAETKTDDRGYFGASFDTPFQAGYHVLVQGGGLNEDILLDELTVYADVANDLLSGRAPANADLILDAYPGSQGRTYRDDASAGAGGDYQLDLAGILDLRNGGNGAVLHPQGNDEDQPAWLSAWCRGPYLEVNSTNDWVWGAVDLPHAPVTLTLRTGAGVEKGVIHTNSDASCTFHGHQFTHDGGQTIDIEPGDRVEFAGPDWSQEVTAVGMDIMVDAAADRVTGTTDANTFLEVWAQGQVRRVPTAADGSFVADFSGQVDIIGGTGVDMARYDDNWNVPYVSSTAPYARANITWDAVDGWFGPNVTVQYTVTDGVGDIKGGATGVARPDGWLDGIGCGCDLAPGDHVTVHASTGFETELRPIPIDGAIDTEADTVSGQMYDAPFPARGGVWVWSQPRGEGWWQDVAIAADGAYTADFSGQFDIQVGDQAEVWYFDENGNQLGANLYTPFLWVRANRAHDWVQGDATPQTTVFVTVTRDSQIIGAGQSDTGGGTWYHVNPQRPEGGNVDMRTGDIVDVTAGELSASVVLIDMEGTVDAAADVVSGKLAGVPFPADVRIEDWRDGESRDLQTDAVGNFSIDFGAYDIHQGDHVGIWYVRPDGHLVGIVRSDFRFEAELRDNDLWGMATPRARVDLEIRTPAGALKGATSVWTDQEGNYGTDFRDATGRRIDIQAGDVISGVCGAKHADMTIPMPFSALYDHEADAVCGQAPAGAQLRVDLWGYGTQWPVADSANSYCATFGGDPGIEVEGETRIDLPAGHSVLVRTRTPTPDLWIQKWSDGQPPAGGYHRFWMRLGNDERADLAATYVTLTDTLLAGMAFSASSHPATLAGNQVVWSLGTLAPGATHELWLEVSVAPSLPLGSEPENCAEVRSAGWEAYPWNNTACDRRPIVENQADLWISGWVSPGDPAPGAEYIYHLDYGNGMPAGSRHVRITDTLPAGTTFVSEWHPAGWVADTSQAGKVIWQADYLPGWSGRYLELRLRVADSVAPGTQLHNRVAISGAAPDSESSNNTWENDAYAQEPYGNISVGKWYSRGIPVAGYEYTTWVVVWNHGNVPATGVILTDTLPAGATFVRATQYEVDPATGDRNLRSDFPPAGQGTGWVRWNLPAIPTWREFQMEVTFRIGASTTPGTELVNRADVVLTDDRDPNNNRAEYRFRTQVPGPNLRVSKWYEWGDLAPGNTIQYQLLFENDGTEPIYDLVFRDILPDHTTLNGWGWEEPAMDGNTLTWTPQWQQNPGDQLGFWLQVRIDDDTAAGALLANTAEGDTSATEVRTSDNIAQVLLSVGPDLRVEKELLDEIRPGFRARYRVRIWNDGLAWARNTVLTDTLPPGLTFVGSDWGGTPGDNPVTWNLGDLNPGWYGEFDMEVEAARTLAADSSVTNRLEITNAEGDAFASNNIYELSATVANPYLVRVQVSHNWVNGEVLPSAHVVVVLRDAGGAEKTRYETDADGDGRFLAHMDQDIVTGDQVEVDTEGTTTIVLPVVRIDGTVDAATNRITGKVYDVPYPAMLIGEVWTENGTYAEGQTDDAGNYALSFAPFDVRNGHQVALWYVRPDDHQIGIVRSAMFVRIYPTDDHLWGSTAPNTAVNVTLRDQANNVKGTASVTSNPDGDWSTNILNSGDPVEINDHDKVEVTAGGAAVHLVVPRIMVLPDAPRGQLTIYSELPDTPLDIRWDSGPGQTDHDLANGERVTTDGSGHAIFDFGPHGGLPLDMNGNLYYYDADGQCIEPWWRAMLEAVAPAALINTTDQALTITGASFQATPTVYLAQGGVTKFQLTNVALVGGTGTVLQATIPAGTLAGVYEIHVYNPDERTGFLADALTIRNPTPTVTAIAPKLGYFDEAISFTVTGSNFVLGAQVLFTDGTHTLTPASVTVVSATQITGTLDLHGAIPGQYDVIVTNTGPDAPSGTLTDGLEVKPRWRIRLPLVLKNQP